MESKQKVKLEYIYILNVDQGNRPTRLDLRELSQNFAINNNYKSVEAGAQGTHKISRGYSPEITYSAHWMKEKNFSDAIKEYLKYEVLEVEKSKKILENYLPFKKEG